MNNDFLDYRENYLAHYGILGMKWGIRRYQPYPSDAKNKGKYLGEKKSFRQKRGEKKIAKALKKSMFEQAWASKVKNMHARNRAEYEEGLVKRNATADEITRENAKRQIIEDDYEREYARAQNRIYEQNQKLEKVLKKYRDLDLTSVSNEQLKKGRAIIESIDADTKPYTDRARAAGKKNSLKVAREKDSYALGFLEAIQNTNLIGEGSDKKTRLKEYAEYLDDPQKYWKKDLSKYMKDY